MNRRILKQKLEDAIVCYANTAAMDPVVCRTLLNHLEELIILCESSKFDLADGNAILKLIEEYCSEYNIGKPYKVSVSQKRYGTIEVFAISKESAERQGRQMIDGNPDRIYWITDETSSMA